MSLKRFLPFFIGGILLTACDKTETKRPEKYTAMNSWEREDLKKPDRIFGDLTIGSETQKDTSMGGIGVNAYLWRASLDTISFMPLSQVEPFTGVIVTDWYTPPETKKERFKATILVLDRTLRADAVRVSIVHEIFDDARGWQTQPLDEDLAERLEETILARARELKFEGNIR